MEKQKLSEWLRKNGGFVHPQLDLFHSTMIPNIRGVVALKNISKGETLLAVPLQCTISSSPQDSNPNEIPCIRWLDEQHNNTLRPFIKATLILMHLLSAGDSGNSTSSSLYQTYLSSLPTECKDCLLNWRPEEKEWLRGTNIDLTEAPQETFTRDILPILSSCPPDHPPFWPPPFNTVEAFVRAAGLVQSRAFSMKGVNFITGEEMSHDGDLYLIPAVDMVNHSTDEKRRNTSLQRTNWAPDDGKDIREEVECFVMRADVDIQAGQEILHTYGELPDAQLLSLYGFIDSASSGAATDRSSKSKHAAKEKNGNGKKRQLSGSSSASAPPTASTNNSRVDIPFQLVADSVRAALDKATDGDKDELRSFDRSIEKKVAALVKGGVLGATMPRDSNYPSSFSSPLSPSLFTTIQVLLMTAEEVDALTDGSKKKKKSGVQPQQGKKKKKDKKSTDVVKERSEEEHEVHGLLDLGWDIWDEDKEGLGQVVGFSIVNISEGLKRRLGGALKDKGEALKGGLDEGRYELARRLREGEGEVMNQLKRVGLLILMGQLDEAKKLCY